MTRKALIEKGAELIESKLGYTNGWAIPSEDYEKLCKEAFIESIDLIESEYQDRVVEAVDSVCPHSYCDECEDALIAKGDTKEAIKQVKL